MQPDRQRWRPPTILAARWRSDDGHQFAEIALRSEQNLGSTRLPDRIGKELHVRLHPDANQVVFVRERNRDAPGSRELFLGTIDNSRAEQRLTHNDVRDDEPCWSPDGSEILDTSEVAGNAESTPGWDGKVQACLQPMPARLGCDSSPDST